MAAVEAPMPGFSFENCGRNKHLDKLGLKAPTAYKTGTTIAGIIFEDGVVLGADTRATEDTVVADKNCSKIHYLADNMYCCGAGTAADTEMTTQMIASQLELHKLNTGRTPRVATANRLLKQMLFRFRQQSSVWIPHWEQNYDPLPELLHDRKRYQGHISAALVLGGVDVTGPHLYSIHPHGSTDKLPYVTMGSGSLAAMATFEDRFKPNMQRGDAVKLVRDAIAAGIFNDLGSGSNIDICVITKDKVEYLRPYDEANIKGQRAGNYVFKRGTTAILSTEVKKIPFEILATQVISTEAMDTA